jgi:GDP-L-fucose synthase
MGEKIGSFRELRVYSRALELQREIFEITKTFPKVETYSLTDQIRRSARSIGANIAEAWQKRRYPLHFVSMENNTKIFVAGHRGLVGSAIVKRLQQGGYTNLVTAHPRRTGSDRPAGGRGLLCRREAGVRLPGGGEGRWHRRQQHLPGRFHLREPGHPEQRHPPELCPRGEEAALSRQHLHLPRDCPQPMKEESLLTGPLEYTNEPYAIAKIAGIKMCESYNLQYGTNFIRSCRPTSMAPATISTWRSRTCCRPCCARCTWRKLLERATGPGCWPTWGRRRRARRAILARFGVSAERVQIWGTGKPRREFLWSEDMADACVFLMENRDFSDTCAKELKEIRNTHINIGTGEDMSIAELAELVRQTVGFGGKLEFDVPATGRHPAQAHRRPSCTPWAGGTGWSWKMGCAGCTSGTAAMSRFAADGLRQNKKLHHRASKYAFGAPLSESNLYLASAFDYAFCCSRNN